MKTKTPRTFNQKSRETLTIRSLHLINMKLFSEPITIVKTINYNDIRNKLKKMINITHIDDSLKKKCIDISKDLQQMDPAERLVFLYDDPGFPRQEKELMLDTCLQVMEDIEEYEVCATIHRMRQLLDKSRSKPVRRIGEFY